MKSITNEENVYLQYSRISMLFSIDEKDMKDSLSLLHVKWTIDNHKYSYDDVQ
jgi:hypothetical protein